MKIRLSETIQNEYATRDVFNGSGEWPLVPHTAGVHDLPIETVKSVLDDAEYNSDPKAQDVGPYGMPLSIFNSYRALAKQCRAALAKVQS